MLAVLTERTTGRARLTQKRYRNDFRQFALLICTARKRQPLGAVVGQWIAAQRKRVAPRWQRLQRIAVSVRQLRLFLIHHGWNARWRCPGEKLHSRVWTRQLCVCPVLLACCCRPSRRKLYDRGDLPSPDPRRPSILHARPRWVSEAQSLCTFSPDDYTH